jgi:hypothetical protein
MKMLLFGSYEGDCVAQPAAYVSDIENSSNNNVGSVRLKGS